VFRVLPETKHFYLHMSDSPLSRLQPLLKGKSQLTLVIDFLQLFSCQEHLKVTKEDPRPCGRKCRGSSLTIAPEQQVSFQNAGSGHVRDK
jgi:hypothetical protein